MLRSNQLLCAVFVCAAFVAFGLSGCSDSGREAGGGGDAGSAGVAGSGGSAGGVDPTSKQHEVLLVGGFMSELYEALSLHLEVALNAALEARARTLNVRIDLPLNQSVDIPIGDAIASALPQISLPIEPGGFISFHTQEARFIEEVRSLAGVGGE